ncbi:MAG: MFS transporter [Coriobacteriia bacterium]|nr:MFS transporter [Coriobacteriia bacterium]MBS5477454.1 MFS transporter [Coriobacteriia bacterium]
MASALGESGPELTAHGKPVPHNWRVLVTFVWIGQAFSILTSFAANYAVVWWLTESTGSATLLTFMTAMMYLPMAVLGPFAGTIVDRFSRRAVMMGADLATAAFALVMALLVIAGHLSVALIVIMMLARSVFQSFHSPAMQALMPCLVPDRHLVRISSLGQGIQSIANIAGPALGILLYTTFGLQAALLLDVGGALIACGCLLFVHVADDGHMATAQRTSVLAEMRDGVRAVRSVRGLAPAFLWILAGYLFFAPMASLFPLMTYNHFGGDGFQASLVEAVWGIGAFVGTLLLAAWGGGRRLMLLVIVSMAGLGAFTLVEGLLPPNAFVAFVILMAPEAVVAALYYTPLMALIQRLIEPQLLGRVMALYMAGSSIVAPIALLISGPLADAWGVAAWFAVCGAGMLIVGIAMWLTPSVRGLDALAQRRADELAAAQAAQPEPADSPLG